MLGQVAVDFNWICHAYCLPERFKATLVDGDSYLLELARYVVLNPVRAGMVD